MKTTAITGAGDLSLREAIGLAAGGVADRILRFDPSPLFCQRWHDNSWGDVDGSGAIEAGETPTQLSIGSEVEIVGPGQGPAVARRRRCHHASPYHHQYWRGHAPWCDGDRWLRLGDR